MNYQDCPDWICDKQNIPYDYIYVLVTVLITIPYLLFVRRLYQKYIVQHSKKRKYFFFLSLPIIAAIYFIGLFFISVGSQSAILSFIEMVSYVPLMFSVWFSYISIILMIILFVVFKLKKK